MPHSNLIEGENQRMLKFCKDKDCLRHGIALNENEFPYNTSYLTQGARDGRNIYCKECCRRRTNEYRETLRVLARRTKVKLPAYFPK